MNRRWWLSPLALIWGAATLFAVDPEYPLFQSLATFPFPEQRETLRQGWEVGVRFAYANVFTRSYLDESISDFEIASLTLTGRKALTRRLTAEWALRFQATGGGFLDQPIEAFHRLLGYPVAGRDLYPKNRVHYRYLDRFDQTGETIGMAAPVLALSYRLIDKPGWDLVARVGGGLPWHSRPGFSSGRGFLLAGLVGGYGTGPFRLELSGHAAWFSPPSWLNRSDLRGQMFLLEPRLTYRQLSIALAVRTSPFRTGDLSSNGYLVSLGWRVSRRIEIGLTEDLSPYDTTPDVGLFLKWQIGPLAPAVRIDRRSQNDVYSGLEGQDRNSL